MLVNCHEFDNAASRPNRCSCVTLVRNCLSNRHQFSDGPVRLIDRRVGIGGCASIGVRNGDPAEARPTDDIRAFFGRDRKIVE